MVPGRNWWDAVVARDRAADGRFVYAVTTTGIYCRPSCSTPTPLERNVRFFGDHHAARAAGYSACKRCTPDVVTPIDPCIAAIGKACALLENGEGTLSVPEVAAAVGISRYRFQRVFKDLVGTTPGAYANTVRVGRLVRHLRSGRSIVEAIYDAGYGSVSRAYERARRELGMTPADLRAGGAGKRVRFAVLDHEDRWVLVAMTEEGVCAIETGDDPSALERNLYRQLPMAVIEPFDEGGSSRVSAAMCRALLPPRASDLPASARDVAFRARLADLLRPGISRVRLQERGACPQHA
ncbi:MAG: helix-turn-helix domain-containing protein [Geminicoccaceae bacterium]|nr:helix-turn-helix domain-containing protein [Geminicoccaceae bacterium]